MTARGLLSRLRRAEAKTAGLGFATRKRRRFGLRTRITLLFALGALALSGVLASITYATTTSSIVGQELRSVEHVAAINSSQVRSQLPDPQLNSGEILFPLDSSSGSLSLLYCKDATAPACSSTTNPHWLEDSTKITPSDIPPSLRAMVLSGTPAEQTFNLNGSVRVAIGVPLPAENVAYFEVFDTSEVARTIHVLLASLIGAAILTTIAGAVLGRWAAKRSLRPLRDASQAALAIASGKLDTRIETNDASDLAVLASSFNRMADRLQQRIERDARFTSDVSHELRSPLTTLRTSLSVIEARRDELPERSAKALELLSSEIGRFQKMLGDLLEISRLDAGSADFQTSTVRAGELVERAVSHTAPTVPVHIAKDAATRNITVDKRRFERIIANLLENAERHAGGATAVRVEASDVALRIIVEDNGPGVPYEERERIFERFARGSVTAGSRGSGDGTGLGLALVSEHAKLHNGTVWVEDRIPNGSRFVVQLPLGSAGSDELDDETVDGPSAPVGDSDSPSSSAAGEATIVTLPHVRALPGEREAR